MTINVYSLHNVENYNSSLSNTVSDVFIKYINLINEFIIQCCENVCFKNVNYNRYIINKGIETLAHVFKMLLLYTMNLELTYHHCQKSLFYYIEFVGQISGDNQQLLQLTLKDSTLFVYKKTIFDINNEKRSNFKILNNDKIAMDIIAYLIKIYNSLLYVLIEHHEFPSDNQSSLLNEMTINVQRVTNNLINLFTNSKLLDYIEQLKIIEHFIETIKNKDCEINKIFNLFDVFIKKMSCQTSNFDLSNSEKIIEKINSKGFDDFLIDNSNKKIINLLFSD